MSRLLTVYPKKYAHGFCFVVLCCGYTLTDFPISIRLTSPALWQSDDCPSASKATLMNMDKYFIWIHYELLHNHSKARHNKTVCIFLGIYCRTGNRKTHLWHWQIFLMIFWAVTIWDIPLKRNLTHWGRDKMAAFSQTTILNAFLWMKMFECPLIFHWSLFPMGQLTIYHRWFRKWLAPDQATSHYLNQRWSG